MNIKNPSLDREKNLHFLHLPIQGIYQPIQYLLKLEDYFILYNYNQDDRPMYL